MIYRLFQSVLIVSLPLAIRSGFASHTVLATATGKHVFKAGNISYLADLEHPRVAFSGHCNEAAENGDGLVLITVLQTDEKVVMREHLENLVTRYIEQDDVYSEAFLEGVYISSTSKDKSTFHPSAIDYLAESRTRYLFVDSSTFHYSTNTTGPHIITYVRVDSTAKHKSSVSREVDQQAVLSQLLTDNNISLGPYAAKIHKDAIKLSTVYRLYADDYENFLFGAYETNAGDKSFKAVDIFEPRFGKAMIPVPSRIYSWGDGRPLAGKRVAIKDLYDVNGLQTAGGSSAYASITPVANFSAVSIQQIIDLGAIIVGKFKTSQFAAGLHPWEWIDVHYPFNPRGDGYLTCSGSSSGGGCAIAAYEWLDFAVGTDTGGSVRRPAASSGTYGNRPSQGMMNMDGVLPMSEALDTAGVFARDPIQWINFAKAWYQPFLHQPRSVTGLSPLLVPDTTAFPKKLLYLTDYLPLANPAAQALLRQFIDNVATAFDLKVSEFDLISTLKSAKTTPPILEIVHFMNSDMLNGKGHWETIARPLISEWAVLNQGRFPPVSTAWRPFWHDYSTSNISDKDRLAHYTHLLKAKRIATDWFESNILFETEESCSESIMIYDIGAQGLPEYREENLNNGTGTFMHYVESEEGKRMRERTRDLGGASICSSFGCVDLTIPIGQVTYRSNVTYVEEMLPVTVNLVARRGCDFMLFNMIEVLVRKGILTTVKTGREAFFEPSQNTGD